MDELKSRQLDIISQDLSMKPNIRKTSFSPEWQYMKNYNIHYRNQLWEKQVKNKQAKIASEIPSPAPFKIKEFKSKTGIVKPALKKNHV